MTLSTPEKPKIDLNQPVKPAIVPGKPSDPNVFLPGHDHSKEDLKDLPKQLPKPAEVIDQPKV